MKKLIRSILLVFMSINFIAQENNKEVQTLFKKDNSVGVFAGCFVKPTLINDQETIFFGSELNMVFGHHLNIGVIGAGTIQAINSGYTNTNGNSLYQEVGYGGFKIEPVLFSHRLIHLTVPFIIGGGASTLHSGNLSYNYGDWAYDYDFYDADFFLLAEPGVNAEINLYKHLRLDIGASYRFTSNAGVFGPANQNVEGLSGNIGLKFGWF